jgi:hypothetical protein
MTLKEKFQQWFINDEEDEHYEGMVELVSIEHEKVADEFAIGFAEWVCNNLYDFPKTEQIYLLEIYKKEKE